jgi:orotidine-5'-phosphate decarboxylase
MKRIELVENIKRKGSFLCVGLDPDIKKIPESVTRAAEAAGESPIFAFNRAIIDATARYCIAYKPNVAFYECHGIEGWKALEQTVRYIREKYPDQFIIADAKRGDIGNTARMYARTFFDTLACDGVTVAPYMGEDSVTPFLEHQDKWTILLALTSNKGAQDFQMISDTNGHRVFERVIKRSLRWGSPVNLMYVVGATQAQYFTDIRAIAPRSFLLVPGVGAQGGSLADVCAVGLNDEIGLIVNSSRAILYASSDDDFAEAAATAAKAVAEEMRDILVKYCLI